MENSAAAQVSVLAPVAIRRLFGTLVLELADDHALRIDTDYDLNPVIANRIGAGERFDMGLTNPDLLTDLVGRGLVDGASLAPFGRVPLALARKGGTGRSLPSTTEEIVTLLRESTSIAYTEGGTSGDTFLRVLADLGLAEELGDRLRGMGAGEPVLAAAAGHSDLAVAPLTAIAATAGVREIAIFPPELASDSDLAMFVTTRARDRKSTNRVIRFLADPQLDGFLQDAGVFRIVKA